MQYPSLWLMPAVHRNIPRASAWPSVGLNACNGRVLDPTDPGFPTGAGATAARWVGVVVDPGRGRGVVDLVAVGRTNAQIAAELFVTTATVKTHVHNIFTKLGLTSRTQLAAAACAPGPPRREDPGPN